MIIFECLRSEMPQVIYDHLAGHGVEKDESLVDYIGGKAYIIETMEDLNKFPEIFPMTFGQNVLTVERFDNAEVVGDYVEFFEASNNAGGNAAFVPRHLFDQNQILKESYELTIEV